MRRFFRLAAILLAMLVVLTACSPAPAGTADSLTDPAMSVADQASSGAEIALIANSSKLESAFGQATWNAISHFSGEAGISCAQYKAEEEDPTAALLTLELAVRGGARLVVTMGNSVNAAIAEAQRQYPDVSFVLLGADELITPRDNTAVVRFSAVQPGWLAGYLAVYEANGAPVALAYSDASRSRQYAVGFLLGAQAAAEEMRAEPGETAVFRLEHTDETTPEEWAALLEAACAENPAVFFIADAALQDDVVALARRSSIRVMGVSLALDATQGALTTVEFEPKALVYGILTRWRDDRFPGGREVTGTLADGDVILRTDLARFEQVGERRFNTALARFDDGTLAATLAVRLRAGEGGGLPLPEELPINLLALRLPGQDEGPPEGGSLPTSQPGSQAPPSSAADSTGARSDASSQT